MGVEGELDDQRHQLARIYDKKPPSTFCNAA